MLSALRAQTVVTTESFNPGSTVFLVSTAPLDTNLLRNGALVSAAGENAVALVRNGSAAGNGTNTTQDPATIWGSLQTVYTFDTTASPAGYNLTAINLFSGWDGSRTFQSFSISYTTVSDATPIYLVGGPSSYFTSNVGGAGSLETSTTLSGGGVLATGVNSVLFNFNPNAVTNPSINGSGTVYREFEVIGTAIPEPSTYAAIFGLVALGVAGVRQARRRRIAA